MHGVVLLNLNESVVYCDGLATIPGVLLLSAIATVFAAHILCHDMHCSVAERK